MCIFCDLVKCPVDCKVDLPNFKPRPVLIGIAQEGRKSPATVRNNMHFPFYTTWRENAIFVNFSPALEGMWWNYSESKGCNLMSESYSIWLRLHRATFSNIVAKLYLLLNASEAKLFSKAEKTSTIYTLVYPVIHTCKKKLTSVYYMLKSLVIITVT